MVKDTKKGTIKIMKVFCDESYNERVFIFSAVVAEFWDSFEELWQQRLKASSLSEFHMSHCQHGKGEFKDLSIDQRNKLQEKFLELMNFSPIVGISIGIKVDDFKSLLPEVKQFFQLPPKSAITGDLSEPYLYAFWCSTEFILDSIRGTLGDVGQVDFFFDNHHMAGRALGIFEQLKLDWAAKNCAISSSFEDSKKIVGLQAADMIAYESLRFFDKTFLRDKEYQWQWPYIAKMLGKEGVNYWDHDGLSRFLADYTKIGRLAFIRNS